MSNLTEITDRFLQAAEVEANTPIGIGGRPAEFLRPAAPVMELLALAKLVELRRRSLGLTPADLAQKAGIPAADLLRLEEGAVGAIVLSRFPVLAHELGLPEAALLELAGVKPDPTGRIHQAAQAFVERTASLAPAPGEAEAMAAFVRDLEAA